MNKLKRQQFRLVREWRYCFIHKKVKVLLMIFYLKSYIARHIKLMR